MMNAIKALALGVGIAVSLPALAFAQSASFSGFADHNGPEAGVYNIGATYEVYTALDEVQMEPWYPFDQALFTYTLVITATVADYQETPMGPYTGRTVVFDPASWVIYKDDVTAPDFADRTTFTDGDAILSGEINGMQGSYIGGIDYSYTVGNADVQITGGSDIGSADCTTLVTNDFITVVYPIGGPEPGYMEGYDPLWTCVPTATDGSSWGQVKGLYR